MYIERELEAKIRKYLTVKEIIAVIGPRQAGKTTLLRRIYNSQKDAIYLDFEDKEILNLFTEDVKSFAKLYAKNYKYIFIDEFHYARDGGKNLKYLYDLYPSAKIIISGSSSLDITVRAVKFLVGRIFVFNLYPLNFSEYLSYIDRVLHKEIYLPARNEINLILKNEKVEIAVLSGTILNKLHEYYDEFVRYGGYPRVVTTGDVEEKKLVLRNIYNTYFLREVRDVLNLSTDRELEKLIKALALQIGNMVSYNELQITTGFNYRSLLKHLSILEKTYISKFVSPFFTNKRKEIVKAPKVYFYDTGLRNQTIGDFSALDRRVDRGYLNENFVSMEFIKRGIDFNYWRTKSKAEVDFVIGEREKIPVEVKSGLKTPKLSKSFISFLRKYNSRIGIIFSNYCFKKISFEGAKIYFLPLSIL